MLIRVLDDLITLPDWLTIVTICATIVGEAVTGVLDEGTRRLRLDVLLGTLYHMIKSRDRPSQVSEFRQQCLGRIIE